MRERDLFIEALEMDDPSARAALLEEACRDDDGLRQRVEQLLAEHGRQESFILDAPPPGVETTYDRPAASERPGTIIGPYKLLEQIGEGGFGVVFLAEQERPVRRKVALKVIKPGMDTRQVIARFEAERQALAMMDHPNIAKVLDAGTTQAGSTEQGAGSTDQASLHAPRSTLLAPSSGRPYFVMELVQGIPITDYCDQCHLPTRERLELFVNVCQAVQHAHQKGVIHRDIKPTNVLVQGTGSVFAAAPTSASEVTENVLHSGSPANKVPVPLSCDRPTPKIIDFGVAKAINQRLTEHTLATGLVQMLGTPLYMSPEQAELSPLGVDTRSDIYSLGVLLYELLTGTTPFDKDRLHAASYDEMRRIIREEEPPRPSARISTFGADAATTVAEHRHTDTRRLRQTVHGELDWIVMKCLEKDRNRRYDSAGSLARDIERYLQDEPVQACPPSAGYRLKKFIRRNKAAAAFVALLLIGIVGLGVSNIAIKRERDAKTIALSRAETISDMLQEMLGSSNPERAKGSQYTVREALDDFSAGLGDQLAGEPEAEAAIRSVIGKSYWRLEVFNRAELHSKKALELRRQLYGPNDERVADSLVDYAWNLTELRRFEEAEKHVRDALLIYQRHNSDPRATMWALWCLQECLMRQLRLAEAEEVANDALALAGNGKDSDYAELPNILHTLADTKSTGGKHEEAEKWARRAVELHRRLQGNHHPETAHGLWILGRALKGQHKFAEAEPPLREALAIFRKYYTPEHRSIWGVSQELASVLEAKGDSAGVAALAREDEEQASRSDTPDYYVRLAELLLLYNALGDAQKKEAHRLIRRAIEAYGQVVVDSPDNLNRRLKAAAGYVEVARICAAAPGFTDELDKLNRLLKSEFSELVAAFPDPAASVNALQSIALMQLRLEDEAGYRATCKALIDVPVRNLEVATKSRSIWTVCLAPNSLDDPNLPVKHAEEFVANSSPSHRYFSLTVLGAALYRAGQYEQAAERFEESIAVYPSVPKPGSDTISYQQLLLAMTKWQLGQRDDARRLLAETLPTVERDLQSPASLWNRRATLELLRDEAEALIGQKEATELVEPRQSADKP